MKTVVMIGTSADAHGGIATVIANYRDSGLLADWNVKTIVSHKDGGRYTKLVLAIRAWASLVRVLLSNRVALLHVHMTSQASTWRKIVFIATSMLFSVPYVIHLHGGNFVEFYRKDCGPVGRRLIRFFLEHAAFVIALSQSWADGLTGISPKARIKVLFNSVAMPLGKADEGEGAAPLILFLGRIHRDKGVFELIRALALLKIPFEAVVAGDGDLKAVQDFAVKMGIQGRVSFPGWITGTAKEALYARTAIFVLPSYHEGVPMGMLEAMSWAIPVVTTPVGGIPEIVSEGREAVFVEPRNVEALAAALEKLLADRLLRRTMGEAGRSRIAEEYTHDALRPQLEQLWMDAGVARPDVRNVNAHP
jgi:glycosyltransferase involved in cell wall biosynthesis